MAASNATFGKKFDVGGNEDCNPSVGFVNQLGGARLPAEHELDL